MGKTSKGFLLLLVAILAVSSIIMVESASAQSISKPSTPEFTIKLVDNSYSVPATFTIDPFTGANVTQPSHRVDNKTIEVIIKNQPFSPILIQEGNSNWTTAFFFNVHFKGHYSKDWIPLYFYGDPFPTPANSDYTSIEYPLELTGLNASSYYLQVYRGYDGSYSSIPTEIPVNAQIDFEVQAMIGNFHRGYNATATDPLQMFAWVFEGQTSDWNIQTIAIPETSTTLTNPTSTLNPTTESTSFATKSSGNSLTVSLSTLIAVGAIFLAIIVALAILFFRMRQKTKLETLRSKSKSVHAKHHCASQKTNQEVFY